MARLAMSRFAVASLVLSLGAAGAVFSTACSSDSNPSPGEDSGAGGSSSGGKSNGGKSNGGSSSGGGSNKDGGTGGSSSGGKSSGGSGNKDGGSGGETDSGSGGSGGGDGGNVTPSTCPPDSTDFWTDKCTDSKCTPFDNSKLVKLVNGKLPDLP